MLASRGYLFEIESPPGSRYHHGSQTRGERGGWGMWGEADVDWLARTEVDV